MFIWFLEQKKKLIKLKINHTNQLITRFLWDGNVHLDEWEYKVSERPKTIANALGKLFLDRLEPLNNLITWVLHRTKSFADREWKIQNISKQKGFSEEIFDDVVKKADKHISL